MSINREHLAPNRVWAIPVRDNGKRTTFYTEQLPFVPGAGVEQLGESVEYAPIAQAAPEAEPVAEVSQETFSSDGTSDIITCDLPIGTKLYTAPQHDVELVELLNLAADTLDDVCHGSMLEQTIRAKLATLRHV